MTNNLFIVVAVVLLLALVGLGYFAYDLYGKAQDCKTLAEGCETQALECKSGLDQCMATATECGSSLAEAGAQLQSLQEMCAPPLPTP